MDFSLEVTPKTDAAQLAALPATVREVSITFLPGADSAEVVTQAQRVRQAGYEPIPHIPARSLRDRPHLQTFLSQLREQAQIRKVLVIGGSREPVGEYTTTLQLLETGLFKDLQVGLAGHPEGSPHLSLQQGEAVLRHKVEFAQRAGLEVFVVTQWSLNPEALINWLKSLQTFHGGSVYLGIPGPATPTALMKYATICGVKASLWGLRRQSRQLAQWMAIQTPDFLVDALQPHVQHFHVYTFGGLERTATWLHEQLALAPNPTVEKPLSICGVSSHGG
ncbi:MAG: hypothetical protein ACFB8W_07825 [Elainellaceae cyanobacterium]